MQEDMKAIFEQLLSGRDLTRLQARTAFERIMAGQVTGSVIGALRAIGPGAGECAPS